MSNTITIRSAGPEDADTIARLAQRDTTTVPAGALLLAEVGGEAVAAMTVDGTRVIADPFRRTADAVELLRSRADQVGRRRRSRAPRVAARTPLAGLAR
jgi:hypothetical protein